MKYRYNQDKKRNKNTKDINLLIPLAIFIVFWFIAYAYFTNESECVDTQHFHDAFQSRTAGRTSNSMVGDTHKYAFTTSNKRTSHAPSNLMSETSDPTSFKMVAPGIQIPKNLPPVLLDLM